MTIEFDTAPDGLLRYKVRRVVRDEHGNIYAVGRALTERFNSQDAAEKAAAAMNRSKE